MNKITTTIRIDWIFQTMMLAGALVMLLLNKPYDSLSICTILLIWQFISAIIIVTIANGRGPRRFLFLAGLVSYYLALNLDLHTDITWLNSLLQFLYISVPVGLMICYWLLTTCNFYPSRDHKGKFLPHTSF